MAWIQVQQKGADNAGASNTTQALAYGSSVTANNRLFCTVTCNSSKVVSSITDTLLLSWTLLKRGTITGNGVTSEIWTAQVGASGGANTVTIHKSGASSSAMGIVEVSGLDTSALAGCLDVSGGGNSTSASPSIATSATTTAANEYCLGVYGDNGDGTAVVLGSTWSVAGRTPANDGATSNVGESKDSGASGSTITANWTSGSTTGSSLVVVVIKLVGGAPPVAVFATFKTLLGVGNI